jgi:soluble lytic murein transglycosylase-like protein
MIYSRLLQYRLPLVRGEDVVSVQERLKMLRFATGAADGIFGPRTERAVREFQSAHGLRPDGKVGPLTWNRLFEQDAATVSRGRIEALTAELARSHAFRDSVSWKLTSEGISIDGAAPERTGGEPATVRRVWRDLRVPIVQWGETLGVPVELIIATICTESGGRLNVRAREEPGYVSDDETPHRVSPGIMQTLISTAREAVGRDDIDRAWLEQPANSIQAGASYIAGQFKATRFDPPKAACAYNAGGVYYNDSADNRWKMRQYPIGTGAHADRFVRWFNDCFAVLGAADDGEAPLPDVSFVRQTRKG